MTRKEQLKEIPYPTHLGDSPEDKKQYALALEVAEHWTTLPKTPEEAKEMALSLPKRLQWSHEGVRRSMLEYLLKQMQAMESTTE
jgi:hypothetical protein